LAGNDLMIHLDYPDRREAFRLTEAKGGLYPYEWVAVSTTQPSIQALRESFERREKRGGIPSWRDDDPDDPPGLLTSTDRGNQGSE
jgi:hypothetical protein